MDKSKGFGFIVADEAFHLFMGLDKDPVEATKILDSAWSGRPLRLSCETASNSQLQRSLYRILDPSIRWNIVSCYTTAEPLLKGMWIVFLLLSRMILLRIWESPATNRWKEHDYSEILRICLRSWRVTRSIKGTLN